MLVKRVVIYSGCSVTFADVHQGALSALFATCLVIVGLLQVGVYRRQARLMRESIDGQTRDMGLYIAEASRAAAAMEGVSVSMAANVEKLTITVATNKEIAARQKLFGEKQMRAYVFLDGGSVLNVADPSPNFVQPQGMPPSEARLQWRDRGPMAALRIKNSGHTPAHNVIHNAQMVLREFPLRAQLPSILAGDEEHRTVFEIPPLGGISTKFVRYGPALTAEQIESLRACTSALYGMAKLPTAMLSASRIGQCTDSGTTNFLALWAQALN
jgi:hypothetical protein